MDPLHVATLTEESYAHAYVNMIHLSYNGLGTSGAHTIVWSVSPNLLPVILLIGTKPHTSDSAGVNTKYTKYAYVRLYIHDSRTGWAWPLTLTMPCIHRVWVLPNPAC